MYSMKHAVLFLFASSLLFVNGCLSSALVAAGNTVKVNPASNFTKGQTILVKQREIDRLEFGPKIAKFFKNAGYNVILASEKNDQANYELVYEYQYAFDVIHNTLESMDVIMRDSKSQEILVNAHFQAYSVSSADGLLQSYLRKIRKQMERPPKK